MNLKEFIEQKGFVRCTVGIVDDELFYEDIPQASWANFEVGEIVSETTGSIVLRSSALDSTEFISIQALVIR